MTTTLLSYIPYISLALAAVALGMTIGMQNKLKTLFRGKKGKDLEEIMATLTHDIEGLEKARLMIGKKITEIDTRMEETLRGVGMVRFNPFKDSGSNQSFAIALLNERKDGVVLSSLYSRERVSVFAKPVTNGASDYELSIEEKEALVAAISKL